MDRGEKRGKQQGKLGIVSLGQSWQSLNGRGWGLIEKHTQTKREGEKKGILSTPISPLSVRRVQSADTGQRSVYSFSPNIIHPIDMPKTPEQSQTAHQGTKTNSHSWILTCCSPRRSADNLLLYWLFKTDLMRFLKGEMWRMVILIYHQLIHFKNYLKQMRPLLKETLQQALQCLKLSDFVIFLYTTKEEMSICW